MTSDEALLKISRSAAEATATVLETVCGDCVEVGGVALSARDVSPLEGIMPPALMTRVSYVDGVTGGNVFALTRIAARKLAAIMMGGSAADVDASAALSELELSAIAEATNQMMAAAAAATSTVLGVPVEISPPETALVDSRADAERFHDSSARATVASFSIAGEPCRLVQFVPHAFVVRMTRAYSDQEGEAPPEREPATGSLTADLVRSLPVRVTVEAGRLRLPLGMIVGLRQGMVLELDKLVSEPVAILLNGRPYARGQLVLDEDRTWAVQLDELPHSTQSQGG